MKWTKDKVFEESRKYTSRSEFKKNSGSAFKSAYKNNWLDDMTWLIPKAKPRDYWTDDMILNESKKYRSTAEFMRKNMYVYAKAVKLGLLGNMPWLEKTNSVLSRNHVFAESRKYTTRSEFMRKSGPSYYKARVNGWLDDMPWLERLNAGYNAWTKDRVFEESMKYTSRSEFHNNSRYAYTKALYNGWLDDMSWLEPAVRPYTDSCYYIYCYIYNNDTVYVGLTDDPKRRHYEHSSEKYNARRMSPVYRFFSSLNVNVPDPVYIERGIGQNDALILEDYYISYFRSKNYNVLNKAKTGLHSGSLGSVTRVWSKKMVFEESLKYTSRSEFKKGCGPAYQKAYNKKWLDDMPWLSFKIRPKNYWTKERVLEESRMYRNITELKRSVYGAYSAAMKNGWLDDVRKIYSNK